MTGGWTLRGYGINRLKIRKSDNLSRRRWTYGVERTARRVDTWRPDYRTLGDVTLSVAGAPSNSTLIWRLHYTRAFVISRRPAGEGHEPVGTRIGQKTTKPLAERAGRTADAIPVVIA